MESTAALHLRARSAMARTAPMTMAVVCQQDFKYELFSVWSGGCGYVGSNAPIGKNRGQLWETEFSGMSGTRGEMKGNIQFVIHESRRIKSG